MWLASGHAVPGGRLAKILKGGKGGPAEDSLKNNALKATSSATSLWAKLILYIGGNLSLSVYKTCEISTTTSTDKYIFAKCTKFLDLNMVNIL